MGLLTKKDKEELVSLVRTVVQEELKALVMRDVVMETGPRKQGDPEKVQKEMTINVIDELAKYLPSVEGALRGVQEDVDRSVNTVDRMAEKVDGMGSTLLSFSAPVIKLARLQASDVIVMPKRLGKE
jgi:hypothetical protein